MNALRLILTLSACLLASCAKDAGNSTSSLNTPSNSGFKPMSERLAENNSFAQDESGNWVPNSDKRSSYDSMGPSNYFNGTKYNNKEYQTGDFSKKSWWGNKEYGLKSFAGNTDGSRFQQSAQQQGQSALESGQTPSLPDKFKTSGYATGAAREAGSDRLGKPNDSIVEKRREVYEQPPIIVDWEQQRSMKMEESKSFLGR